MIGPSTVEPAEIAHQCPVMSPLRIFASISQPTFQKPRSSLSRAEVSGIVDDWCKDLRLVWRLLEVDNCHAGLKEDLMKKITFHPYLTH